MPYVFFALAGVSLLAGVVIWRSKLEPLRLHRGESGVRPDRYGEFLNPEWYRAEAVAWLRLVRILWIASPVMFVLAFILWSAA